MLKDSILKWFCLVSFNFLFIELYPITLMICVTKFRVDPIILDFSLYLYTWNFLSVTHIEGTFCTLKVLFLVNT